MESENAIVSGGGSQTGASRWGDYTSMAIDPGDDCTFVYTNEYYATTGDGGTGHWSTRIASLKFPSCVSGSSGEHAFYISTDQHVHQLSWNGNWRDSDLTALAGAPPAALGSAFTSFFTSNIPYVNYLTGNGHVHVLTYSGGWGDTDLTALTGAPPAVAGSALTSSVDGGIPYVDYLTGDGHVHTVWYNSGWRHSDLTALAGAPNAIAGSALNSLIF